MRILVDGQTLVTPEINRGIGVYFKTVLNTMIENDMSCEWHVTVPDIKYLQYLKPSVLNRIQPVVRREFNPNSIYSDGYSSQADFSRVLREEIAGGKIDVYWNPNPLMYNVFFPAERLNTRMVVTIHDLIPLIFPGRYLRKWPEQVAAEYLLRLRRIGGWAGDLIFVSRSTQKDFHNLVQGAKTKGKVVYEGVGNRFRVAPTEINNVEYPYILCVGGFDYRKNMENTLKAFARLVNMDGGKELTADLKLVVVCAYTPEMKEAYEGLAGSLGVAGRLVLTSYVSDSELQRLYRECRVFFFPSLYEGFGLPVLEAMASGVPVVVSNNSSLPEIGGEHAYYCSPGNVEEMAGTLLQALQRNGDNMRRTREGAVHARQFTWERTARETLEILRGSTADKSLRSASRPKLAYVSPLPPQRTGIAGYYSKHLLPHLSRYFDIHLFSEASGVLVEGVWKSYPTGRLENLYGDYDSVLYHLGNNTLFHKQIYDLAWRMPGIIVLHDYNIHPFMLDAYFLKGNIEMYGAALEEGYGREGAEHFSDIMAGRQRPAIWKYPMSHAIVKRSKATIVHHRWVRAQFPGEGRVFVIPLLARPHEADKEKERAGWFRAKYGVGPKEFIIGCFGFINKNKRPGKVIHALKILRDKGFPARVFFAGELSPEIPHLVEFIKGLGLQEAVTITGYLSDEEYGGALAAADMVVNLRYPSMGEASATLAEALSHGKPTIVSRVNQYLEYPDHVCWKLDVGKNEAIQLAGYLETLIREKGVRERLGHNARKFAGGVMGVESVAEEYWRVINKCARGNFYER
ncbi:MAG: glycosyltransferase [Bacillota bacterium]